MMASISRKLRFALVGCGRISQKHFEAIQKHGDTAELIGVCDTDRAKSVAAAKAQGAPVVDDYSKLLALRPDVVVIATPSGLHAEQAIRAAEAGCHVVCEKPMATLWEDGKRMVEAFDSNQRQLFVVKQNRFNPTIRRLKQAITGGRFGRVFMVTANVFWSRPQEYYDSARWRGTWELDGGAIMNQASHYVDLLDWLFGPVDTVHAFTGTLARNIQVEDTGVVGLKWRSGTLGSLNVTMLAHTKNFEGSITIIGEHGTCRLGGTALNRIEHWSFLQKTVEDQEFEAENYQTASVYGNGHDLYYSNVVNTLRGKESAETDGREGLRSLELLISIYLSARDRRRVALPLDVR